MEDKGRRSLRGRLTSVVKNLKHSLFPGPSPIPISSISILSEYCWTLKVTKLLSSIDLLHRFNNKEAFASPGTSPDRAIIAGEFRSGPTSDSCSDLARGVRPKIIMLFVALVDAFRSVPFSRSWGGLYVSQSGGRSHQRAERR